MAAREGTRPLVQEVLGRLTADKKPDPERDMLVLAALDGSEALAGYLDGSAARPTPEEAAAAEPPPTREPLGAYLKSITVEGFRGIGKKLTLDIPPGPGLTLVVGRNGSGKSSFADALELLLTGDTYRWSHRAKVWKQGWRNLHHKTAAIEAEFFVEGDKPTTVASRWKDDAELEAAETFAQTHGKPRMNVADLGWKAAVLTYRPILSFANMESRGRPRSSIQSFAICAKPTCAPRDCGLAGDPALEWANRVPSALGNGGLTGERARLPRANGGLGEWCGSAIREAGMAHEVKLKLNTNVVAYKDVEISVRDSSGKLGTLLISKGNVEWLPAGKSVKKHRFTWAQFAERMQEGKTVRAKR